jgi:hypothetical protein
LFLSCNTNKNTSETSNIDKHALSIQLEESLSGKYISNTYSECNPTDISPSNKTLNQYVANFNCSSSAFSKMKTLMEADTKVEIIQNTNTSDRQSSKSVKSAKTKSIRENN